MDKEIMFEYIQRLKLAVITLFKWLFCSVVCGCFIGSVGAVFHLMLGYVGSLRVEYPFLLFGLPVAGIIIVFMYNIVHEAGNRGTNLVITAIQSNDEVPGRVAPLIIVSTLLTHLCGGSAGREGAALQVGGAIGNTFAKLFKFDEKDTRIMIMCGMSACFSAPFRNTYCVSCFLHGSNQRRCYVLCCFSAMRTRCIYSTGRVCGVETAVRGELIYLF